MIVYLLFLIILFLLFLFEVNNRQINIFKKGFFNFSNLKNKIEHFDGTPYSGPLNMVIQVDDEFKVFFKSDKKTSVFNMTPGLSI